MSVWEIRMATADDMGQVHRLQAIPMQGMIRLSLATPIRAEDRVIIAFKHGKLMGMGARMRARHHWSGQSHSVGVLTSLRSECDVLPRRTVTEMYRQLRAAPPDDEPPWELTAILEGNHRARRLLEAGLPGFPRYTEITQASTLTFNTSVPMAAGKKGPIHEESPSLMGQFESITEKEHSCLVESIAGHRTIIAGYSPILARARPILDALLKLSGRPGLPKAGTELREAFVVDAQWVPGNRPALASFAKVIRSAAKRIGAELVHWGLPSHHPDKLWLKSNLRAWETRSIVYAVHDADLTPPRLVDFRPEISRL